MYTAVKKFIELTNDVVDAFETAKTNKTPDKHGNYTLTKVEKDQIDRKFAICLNYGMDTFGFPQSQDESTLNPTELAEMNTVFSGRGSATSVCVKYKDIPPTVMLPHLVVFFARYLLAGCDCPINPHNMTLTVHGKKVDVWHKFVNKYCYLILKA